MIVDLRIMPNLFPVPVLTRGRIWAAFLVAMTADAAQILLGPLGWLFHHALFEPAHFVMERKMMLGIKRLAEASARAVAAEPLPRGLNMIWDSPKIEAEESEANTGLTRYETDANRFELRCGMCGELYSARDIEAREEITFDYGEAYFDEHIRPKGCKCAACR